MRCVAMRGAQVKIACLEVTNSMRSIQCTGAPSAYQEQANSKCAKKSHLD